MNSINTGVDTLSNHIFTNIGSRSRIKRRYTYLFRLGYIVSSWRSTSGNQ
nr:MAG TPA: hypothetical protein [Caudoviricetes sp.]